MMHRPIFEQAAGKREPRLKSDGTEASGRTRSPVLTEDRRRGLRRVPHALEQRSIRHHGGGGGMTWSSKDRQDYWKIHQPFKIKYKHSQKQKAFRSVALWETNTWINIPELIMRLQNWADFICRSQLLLFGLGCLFTVTQLKHRLRPDRRRNLPH